MSTAQRFLHADGPGHLIPTRLMLPIRQNLNRLTALNRTQRAVLIEVAEMAENGSHKAFTTDNAYLIERIGGTIRTISRALGLLQQLGLLRSTGATKLRRITTTARLRGCYTGSEAEQFAAIEGLNVALENAKESNLSIDKNETSIDNGGSDYRHSGYVSIDNGGSVSRHSGSVYKETTKNDQKDEQTVEVEALRSALAAAEKKNTELVAANTDLARTNAELSAEVEKVTHQRDQLRNSLNAVRPGSATASASHTGGAGGTMSFADSEFSTEAGFLALAASMNCAQACAAYYLPDMRVKALALGLRDAGGWRNYVHSWLKRERDSAAGVMTQVPTATPGPKAGQVERRMSAIERARMLDNQQTE